MLTLFKNGNVYDSNARCFTKRDILVNDGKIESLTYEGECDNTVDLGGMYVMPGLVDVHTHGRGGYDFNNASFDDVVALRHSYAAAGTTTLMATLASAEMSSLESSIKAIGENRAVIPGTATLAGTHLEGRYLNPKRRGAHNEQLLAPLDSEELIGLMNRMLPLPIHVSAAFELENGEQFAKTAVGFGATCGMAHSDATYEEATNAVEWGITSFTHTYNAMRPIHHREPGNMVASLITDSAYSEFIVDGEHSNPAMVRLAARCKPADRLVLITDSMEAAGMPDGTYGIAGLPVIVKNGRAVNSDGALAGSTLSLFNAIRNFMRFTGMKLEEVIPFATKNPANMVGIYDSCGSIEAGKRADFIVIESKENPEITAVYASGEEVK